MQEGKIWNYILVDFLFENLDLFSEIIFKWHCFNISESFEQFEEDFEMFNNNSIVEGIEQDENDILGNDLEMFHKPIDETNEGSQDLKLNIIDNSDKGVNDETLRESKVFYIL